MNIKNTIMNPEEIKQLLERYYEGKSTLEEEHTLKNFFSQENIPEHLTCEKEIFRYYIQSSEVPEPSSGFENSIISALDSVDERSERLKRRRIFGVLTGIAAGILILTGTYFYFVNKSEPRDTYSDPELAYAETMKILYNVSERLNQGTRALGQINELQNETRKSLEAVNKSTTIIKEKMKPLNNLFEAMEKINTSQQSQNANH
jgi:hypothetical protein